MSELLSRIVGAPITGSVYGGSGGLGTSRLIGVWRWSPLSSVAIEVLLVGQRLEPIFSYVTKHGFWVRERSKPSQWACRSRRSAASIRCLAAAGRQW